MGELKTARVRFKIAYVDRAHLADVLAKIGDFMWVSDIEVLTYDARKPKRASK